MITAIVNGIVVNESSAGKATLVIRDGIIKAFLTPDTDVGHLYPGCRIIDADGQYIVPGGVDGHVHFGGFGTIPIMDDFYTGSWAALAGGTTTVVDFCEPKEGEEPLTCIAERKEAGRASAVDYALHYTFTENWRRELECLPDILDEGIRNFKAYTYYPNTSLLPGDFRCIMERIHDQGSLLVHAEEKSIIDRMRETYSGDVSDMRAISWTRPNISEQIAVESVLTIAKETGTRLCIAHASTSEAVAVRKREKAAGNDRFFLESCPHYMQFTVENMKGPEGALFTINPPLRSRKDADCLKDALANEDISILSTDHCPYSKSDKKQAGDYTAVPCGVDGVQTRMMYAFSEEVLKRGMSMPAFVRVTSTNAAKFYGLFPRKGTIAPGSDADLAFFDPTAEEWTYSMKNVAGATDYSVFDGFRLKGRCTCTIRRGEVVMKDGEVLAERGSGQYLPVPPEADRS